jgi:predicted CoA-substrate-specific enzyme activase
MIYAGIDAGSRSIKIVLIDAVRDQVIASGVTDQGVQQNALATTLFNQLLEEKHLSKRDIKRIVATGYGRNLIDLADTTVTEITCHAAGVRRVRPDVMTIIDIGGQDSKLIRLDEKGRVRDFVMNDRCAAGTGRFMEIVAKRLEVPLEMLGEMAKKSKSPAAISSMCVVFAETEIIGLLAGGAKPEDIVAGVEVSIAGRITAMSGRRVSGPIVFTGGGAKIPGMAEALSHALGQQVAVAPEPQTTGALGAAILAGRTERSFIINRV